MTVRKSLMDFKNSTRSIDEAEIFFNVCKKKPEKMDLDLQKELELYKQLDVQELYQYILILTVEQQLDGFRFNGKQNLLYK